MVHKKIICQYVLMNTINCTIQEISKKNHILKAKTCNKIKPLQLNFVKILQIKHFYLNVRPMKIQLNLSDIFNSFTVLKLSNVNYIDYTDEKIVRLIRASIRNLIHWT